LACFFLCCILLLQTACNLHIEKRRYNKGYHVEWAQQINKKNTATIHQVPVQSLVNRSLPTDSNTQAMPHQVLDSTQQKNNQPHINKTRTHIANKKNQVVPSISTIIQRKAECDIIRFWDGTSIEAIIISVSSTEIGYKKCNFADGPTYKTSTSRVKEIETKNGEIIRPGTTNNNQPNNTPNSKGITGGMTAGMVLAIIAFICLIIGLVLILLSLGFFNLFAALPLAIAGITSLIGLIISSRYLRKGWHPLGTVSFVLNLIFQVLAIIFTVLMFII
jgi:hypothetical protein